MPMAVIFDMDGVLIDSTDAHLRAWQWMGRELGTEVTAEMFARTLGNGNHHTIPMLFGDGFSQPELDDIALRKEEVFRSILRNDGLPVMPGAPELLERLAAAGWRMALGTSAPAENADCVMELLPGSRHIAARINSTMVKNNKPAPDVFLLAATMLETDPRRCVVIDDSPTGLTAAERAGMGRASLTSSYPRRELESMASLVVDSLHEFAPASLEAILPANLPGEGA